VNCVIIYKSYVTRIRPEATNLSRSNLSIKTLIMKPDRRRVTVLNSLPADELTAMNRYLVNSEMCKNWGYFKLHMAMKKQALDDSSDTHR
jgi:hypothetical protein